jgi:hypothetical protein
MFFIGIDSAGRLLTKNAKVESADQDFYCLPEISSSFISSQVSNWFEKNGIESLSEPEFFEVRFGTTTSGIEYCIASVKLNANSPSDFCFERLDQIWKEKLDLSITMAMNRIVGEIAIRVPEFFWQLEQSLTADFVNLISEYFLRNLTLLLSTRLWQLFWVHLQPRTVKRQPDCACILIRGNRFKRC